MMNTGMSPTCSAASLFARAAIGMAAVKRSGCRLAMYQVPAFASKTFTGALFVSLGMAINWPLHCLLVRRGRRRCRKPRDGDTPLLEQQPALVTAVTRRPLARHRLLALPILLDLATTILLNVAFETDQREMVKILLDAGASRTDVLPAVRSLSCEASGGFKYSGIAAVGTKFFCARGRACGSNRRQPCAAPSCAAARRPRRGSCAALQLRVLDAVRARRRREEFWTWRVASLWA